MTKHVKIERRPWSYFNWKWHVIRVVWHITSLKVWRLHLENNTEKAKKELGDYFYGKKTFLSMIFRENSNDSIIFRSDFSAKILFSKGINANFFFSFNWLFCPEDCYFSEEVELLTTIQKATWISDIFLLLLHELYFSWHPSYFYPKKILAIFQYFWK